MVKCREGTYWKTTVNIDREKIRTQVSAEEARPYFARRAEIVEERLAENLHEGMTQKEASAVAWKQAYKILWAEFNCCYYTCKTFVFSAFTESDQEILLELYELVSEISRKEGNNVEL